MTIQAVCGTARVIFHSTFASPKAKFALQTGTDCELYANIFAWISEKPHGRKMLLIIADHGHTRGISSTSVNSSLLNVIVYCPVDWLHLKTQF